jgi:hypothetical protein
MRWYIVDCARQARKREPRIDVTWIEAAKEMGQLGQGDRGMVDDSHLQEEVDLLRRSSLEHIQIDAGVQEQLTTSGWLEDERQLQVGASVDWRGDTLRLYPPQ